MEGPLLWTEGKRKERERESILIGGESPLSYIIEKELIGRAVYYGNYRGKEKETSFS